MSVTAHHHPGPRPRSPWTGSQHQTRHRWQLDVATSLAEVAQALQELAGDLTAAHHAGWWLVEPMRGGHLVAARASRRRRGPAPGSPPRTATSPSAPRWRLRVVDEPPVPRLAVFDAAAAPRTPVLALTGRSLRQVGGPDLPADVLAGVLRHVMPTGLPHRLWGVAPGPGRTERRRRRPRQRAASARGPGQHPGPHR